MRFLKLEKGWKCLETDHFFEFGEIALDCYRFYDKRYGRNCTYETQNENIKELEEHFGKELSGKLLDAVYTLFERINDLVWDEDYATPITDFKVFENSRWASKEEQVAAHHARVELLRKQGWKDFPENKDVKPFTMYLLASANTNEHNVEIPFLPFSVYPHFIDSNWVFAYEVQEPTELLFLDLIEMQKQNYKFGFCKYCDIPFIKKRKNQKCCSDACKTNNKKELEKNRTNTISGYKKKVYNYMYSSKKFTRSEINNFLTEFEEKKATLSEEQTVEWLMNKHEEFKSK